MKRHEKYIERSDLKGATHIEVSVRYTKGGANYFSGGTTPRGYYLAAKAVTKRDNSISYVLFSGQSRLLLETSRFTEKQFARAKELAKSYEDELVAAVVAENQNQAA